jgi:hypothetical protein
VSGRNDLADAPLTKRQARLIIALSTSMTEGLLAIAKDADSAYLLAIERGGSCAEVEALAKHGLEAAEHLHGNLEAIMYATMRAQERHWRNGKKVDQRVRSKLGPHVDQVAEAVAGWKERIARHAEQL